MLSFHSFSIFGHWKCFLKMKAKSMIEFVELGIMILSSCCLC